MPASLRLVDHQWTITTQQDRAIQSKVSVKILENLGPYILCPFKIYLDCSWVTAASALME